MPHPVRGCANGSRDRLDWRQAIRVHSLGFFRLKNAQMEVPRRGGVLSERINSTRRINEPPIDEWANPRDILKMMASRETIGTRMQFSEQSSPFGAQITFGG